MYFIYILASKKNGTLYIGVTDDLLRRVIEHKEKISDGFTKTYNVDKLVYFEQYKYINDALFRETNLKRWRRQWKINLIEQKNRNWNDLINEISNEREIEEMRKYVRGKYGMDACKV